MRIRFLAGHEFAVIIVLSVVAAVSSFLLLHPISLPDMGVTTPPNTIPPDTTLYVQDGSSGFGWLFLVYALVNASVVSGALLLSAKVFKGNIGMKDRTPMVFFATFVVAIASITAIATIVVFYLVTEVDSVVRWSGIGGFPHVLLDVHVLHLGLLEWSSACAFIFASVVCSMMVVGMRSVPSVFMALIVTVFYPVMWLLTMQFGEDVTFLSIFFSILSSPILLAGSVKYQAILSAPPPGIVHSVRIVGEHY